MSYSYFDTKLSNTLAFGSIGQKSNGHQFNFTHKIKNQWLLNLQTNLENNSATSENFLAKNFILDLFLVSPKVSYLLDNNKRFDLYYQYFSKDNLIQNLESLEQHKWGVSAVFTQNQKAAVTFEANYFSNNFIGDLNPQERREYLMAFSPEDRLEQAAIPQMKIFENVALNNFKSVSYTHLTLPTKA